MSVTYSPSQLIGKRKKKRVDCPNPLFCQWLQEWRDEAADAGSKIQYTYAKALSNLQKYPLYLPSGKDCKHLKFFGDKICNMLDAKLAEHRAQHGNELPPDMIPEEGHPRKRKTLNPPTATISTLGQAFAGNGLDLGIGTSLPNTSLHSWGAGQALVGQTVDKKKTRVPSGGREYIPAHRSGPYALILALYRNQQDEHGRGFMLKRELITAAQPLCDKSLSVSDPGSHYTGFSSMGTLIKKGFVIKESSPAKYSLTEAGSQLARKILAAEELNQPNDNPPMPRFVIGSESPVKKQNSAYKDIDKSVRKNITTPEKQPALETFGISPVKTDQKKFQYWYVTENNRTVNSKDLASVTFEEQSIWFLVKCRLESLLKFCHRYKLDSTRAYDDSYVYAYIPDEVAEDISTPPKVSLPNSTSSAAHRKPSPLKQPLMTNKVIEQQIASQSSTASQSSASSMASDQRTPQTMFTLFPGDYDIVLIVDNCEHYGQRNGKQNLLPDLMKNGVDCDVRKLHVGDFLWIAKERVRPQPGQLRVPESRELVFDFVIERKRMDDLAGSIKDGRFKEQKFRMKHSGLRKPIYLVEEYGSQQFSLPEDTLQRSVINTQVIDGFFVKHTQDTKESVAYLTVMTRYLQKLYSNKKLIARPREDIQAQMDEFDVGSNEHCLMTFPEFNKGSVKNKVMTIKETFGKQLMQIAGMSADKTQAILEKYKTVQQLLQAYDICTTEKEKELLLSKIKSGALNRNLGIALSRVIYLLYNTRGPLS
ncbi:structure-specific endonuclease subunit MUS81-like [Tubulanus polymorphus]|uniref:structure-specific endonuclease subunit MUS81-like n=1 Tax=Tubulanus polymorphus TaxID=672921 RepID=UPI003DA51A6F